jgi:type I restriction enzyme, R subunit
MLEALPHIHKVPQIYINQSVDELDTDKLTPVLKLRYTNALNDAIADWDDAVKIRKAFVEFQRNFYNN